MIHVGSKVHNRKDPRILGVVLWISTLRKYILIRIVDKPQDNALLTDVEYWMYTEDWEEYA